MLMPFNISDFVLVLDIIHLKQYYMKRKLFTLLCLMVCILQEGLSQCTTTLNAANGTSGNARCPSVRWRAARGHYLISAAEISAAGFGIGNQVDAIGWSYSTAPGLVGTGNLKVYLENTTDVSNLKSATWATAISSMTMTHSAATTLPNVIGFFDVNFTGGVPFTYTGGGVYVAFDWDYCVGTLSALAAANCNTSVVPIGLWGAQSAASCAAIATMNLNSTFRPITRFTSTVLNDVKTDLIYTLGEMPLSNTTGHVIQARVTNPSATVFTNFDVTLDITGANNFTDVQTISALPACGSQIITFAPFTPTSEGNNTVSVTVPPDNNNANNAKSVPQIITTNRYSYRHPGEVSLVGVGIGNATTPGTGGLCNKFNTNTSAILTHVNVHFTTTSLPYKLAIYGDNGSGGPSTTALYMDATDRFTDTTQAFQALSTPVTVPAGNFFVAVLQTGTTNFGFRYITEAPLRVGSLYFTGILPVASWTDLGPANGFRSLVGVKICIPTAVSSISGPLNVSTCSANTYSVTANPDATSYTWTLPSGWTGTSTTNTIVATSNGNSGNITCMANFVCGSGPSSSIAVNGNQICVGITAPPINCNGGTTTLTALAGGGTAPYTYSWVSGYTPGIEVMNLAKDNTIYQANTGNSNGAGISMAVGTTNTATYSSNRGLIAFSFPSSIPIGSIITNAELNINVSQVASPTSTIPINHYMHKLLQNWGEGTSNAGSTGIGVPATAGDATWLNSFHPSTSWNSNGGDFTLNPSAVLPITGIGVYTWNTPGMVADLQEWLNVPSSNHGWLFKSTEDAAAQARRYDTKESANPPELIIDFDEPIISSTGTILSNVTAGTYTVMVVDANNNVATTVITITQPAPNPLTCSPISSSSLICSSSTYTLSASAVGGGAPYSYSWNDGAGGIYPNAASINPTLAAGTYTITCTISDPCGANCSSSAVLVVNPSPAVTLSASSLNFCNPGTGVTLTAGGAVSYTYTNNSSLFPPAGSPVVASPLTTTTYVVTGTDGIGCSATSEVTIISNPAVALNALSVTPGSVSCGGSVALAASYNYCTAGALNNGCSTLDEYISNVTFGSINNSSTCPGSGQYQDFSNLSTSISAGNTYLISVTNGNSFAGDQVTVWVDWNQNGGFDDANETYNLVYAITTVGSIAVPANAINGNTRMRVRLNYTGAMLPCGIVTWGEVEDYTVNVSGGISGPTINYAWSQTGSSTLGGSITANETATAISANTTYTVTATSSNGCTATATNGVTVTGACNTTINLTCFIEGYWDGVNQMKPVLLLQGEPTTVGACDSIDVELHSDTSPYGLDYSVRTVLQQNGTATCIFPPVSGDKYIVVKHRNAVQTWSTMPVTMGASLNYNFSDFANKAFGNNMVQVSSTPSVWALFSGDIIIDENIDLLDLSALESDISNFAFGYLPTDVNGDGNVDLLDSPILESNINGFIFSNHP